MPAPDMTPPRVLHLRSSCGLYGAEGVIRGLVRSYSGESTVVCLADAREPHTELCDLLSREGYETETLAVRGALLAVSAAYFVISWGRGGQTIGMRAWRLRVVGADGQRLPWSRALLRFAVALVSLAVFGLGFIWCLFDRQRRGWHDIAAHSCVVRLHQ